MKAIVIERTGDRQVDQLQRNLIAALTPVLKSPFGDGQWIRSVQFSGTSTTRVSHGLGRAYNGWVVTRLTAASATSLAELTTQPAGLAAKSIDLVASQTCTADLWVF